MRFSGFADGVVVAAGFSLNWGWTILFITFSFPWSFPAKGKLSFANFHSSCLIHRQVSHIKIKEPVFRVEPEGEAGLDRSGQGKRWMEQGGGNRGRQQGKQAQSWEPWGGNPGNEIPAQSEMQHSVYKWPHLAWKIWADFSESRSKVITASAGALILLEVIEATLLSIWYLDPIYYIG